MPLTVRLTGNEPESNKLYRLAITPAVAEVRMVWPLSCMVAAAPLGNATAPRTRALVLVNAVGWPCCGRNTPFASMPPCVEVRINVPTPLSTSWKSGMSRRTSEVSPDATARRRKVPLSAITVFNCAVTPDNTGVVSSRSVFASVR